METTPPEKTTKKSGTENRLKSKIIGFRADPVERAEIEAAAQAAGLTVGSFVRATILKKARTVGKQRPTIDKVLLTKALGDLGKIGSNLNQIARKLNEGGGVGLGRIVSSLDDLTILKDEIIKAIRRPYDNQGQEQRRGGGSSVLPDGAARE